MDVLYITVALLSVVVCKCCVSVNVYKENPNLRLIVTHLRIKKFIIWDSVQLTEGLHILLQTHYIVIGQSCSNAV